MRIHAKAVLQALPISILLVVEGKDMYYRATWDVSEAHAHQLRTGDCISICNRWYQLPSWGHCGYALLSKALLKSSFDDCAVVCGSKDGQPCIIFSDYRNGFMEMSLEDYIAYRHPRGMAVRKLKRDGGDVATSHSTTTSSSSSSKSMELSPAVASMFCEVARTMPAEPWYLFSASFRHTEEHAYYTFAVGMNEQRRKIRGMIDRDQSIASIHAQQAHLREMEVMRQHLADNLRSARAPSGFHLFNGSLVASFLATFGLLDRELPSPSRFVPQDFAHDLPFVGATTLEEPVVFYKS